MQIQVKIVSAFVEDNKGGNPAGVVLDADGLTKEQKLEIAGKVGLSETAFVSHSNQADFKLDFFTPNRQIAHCGHATIATFSYLEQLGRIPHSESSKETIEGPRKVFIRDGNPYMEQRAPTYRDVSSISSEVMASLGLEPGDLLPNAPIQVVDTGNAMLIVPVNSAEALRRITPNLETIDCISEDLDLIGYYVFSLETQKPGRDATVRMFAPRYGIAEESATGMGAGTLACYLHDVLHIAQKDFLIEQGYFMSPPAPSLLTAELNLGADASIVNLLVGGKGIVTGEKSIYLSI